MSCARWLQRDGRAVTVIDPSPPGESCSFGNAGIISMGSVVPLATPGMLRRLPGYLLDPLGPLTVRWRYLPQLAPWLIRLLAAGRPRRFGPIADALRALNAPALDAYRTLLAPEDFADLIRHEGVLYVYESETALDADAEGWKMRRARGVRFTRLGCDELRQVEPALGPGFACAVLVEDAAHVVNSHRLVTSLAERFLSDGGRILAERVGDVEIGDAGPRAVLTDRGRRACDALVVAAGAWSRGLAARLGNRVPLETERGYHVTLPSPGVTPRRPVAFPAGGFIATPMEMGLRIAGTVELGGLEAPPDYRRTKALLEHGRRLFPGLDGEDVSEWMGFRPSLPDSLPVIGRSSRVGGVYYAFGHGHLGLTEGAITGKLVAELVAGRPTSIDVRPYRPDRF